MGLNDTPSSERIHIGFCGVRNAGKSSLVNAVTGQELSVVSDTKGTTTDPVRKAMELLPLGPVLIIDTPGLDDTGELGEKRIRKTREVLSETDIAVLVKDASSPWSEQEKQLTELFKNRGIPYVTALTKADLLPEDMREKQDTAGGNGGHEIRVSARTGLRIREFKELLGSLAPKKAQDRRIVSDLLAPGDTVVLVVPIDEAAPKGRLILPQQLVIRDLLDAHCMALVCRETELKSLLSSLSEKPRLVITDSQAFKRVSADTPEDIPLTGFSILMARYKGELAELIKGAEKLSSLTDKSRVLISEGCTHHRQCGDIGSVKLPAWIREYCHAEPEFEFTSGNDFPAELPGFDLIVHCGGCMLNGAEMKHRISLAREAGVPVVNYGIAIAEMHGILQRSLEPFSGIL